ncbi:glycoside hydrolase family 2 protein [Botryobasidium botryosum FD-172 SS1]|uniref:Beta-mannosidase B n=1 Tax=Botryobasidium botryosum (strain FD-172 SS1) TaxID=930990 RepID=A0A067M876_BOTB1|nr:glycoside hydrolase family 2 protein [Botryobasidium botryosum FD-172 SS1]
MSTPTSSHSRSHEVVNLNTGWSWKQRDPSIVSVLDEINSLNSAEPTGDSTGTRTSWRPAISFPSEIHIELLKAGLIPDPYVGFNEHKVQWIGDREWLYTNVFDLGTPKQNESLEIEFQGLDTYCDVYLNGALLLKTDNQFLPYTVSLSPSNSVHLLPTENRILLHFRSAKLIAKVLEAQYGTVRAGSCNLGDPSRVYVRKAQYDWSHGPELMTVAPYLPILLHKYAARICALDVRARVSSSLIPSLSVSFELSGLKAALKTVRVKLLDRRGLVIKEERVEYIKSTESRAVVNWEWESGEIDLWWPVHYGEQVLYTVEVVLEDANAETLDIETKRVGFRRVELVQEDLGEADRYGKGTTFLFEINNVRIFMGGSNWIPADNFLTTITPERYRKWLELLRDGNQNMVRVWGGGIYEPGVFYDICDELGILVWQDFQFACGVYPAHDSFVAQVKAEAEANVARLRHHPSLVLWCGNNEDYQQILQWDLKADLPAKIIYEEVLPEVVARLAGPDIPYWRGSPYGGKGWDTADPTVGDVHAWNIWAGMEPWQSYDVQGGRFVSEFGLPAMPNIRTIDHWLDGNVKDRYAQSKSMMQHNKAGSHERRFAVLMNENFRLTGDLESHAYFTQVLQSEGLGYAYRVWRREWRGPGKQFCGGALVWQLNDCWPVTSWAIADYFLRPKPAYFAIARELRPVTVGILRLVEKNRVNDRPRQFYEFGAFQAREASVEIWGTNSTLAAQEAILELLCSDLESPWRYSEEHKITLLPNQSVEILSIPCPHPPQPPQSSEDADPPATSSHSVVISARLIDPYTKRVLARATDWPQPYRLLEFPDPRLQIRVDGEKVSIKVEKPLKALVLSVEGEGEEVNWSDNGFDVTPGDPLEIQAKGLNGRKLKVAFMGREHAFIL